MLLYCVETLYLNTHPFVLKSLLGVVARQDVTGTSSSPLTDGLRRPPTDRQTDGPLDRRTSDGDHNYYWMEQDVSVIGNDGSHIVCIIKVT